MTSEVFEMERSKGLKDDMKTRNDLTEIATQDLALAKSEEAQAELLRRFETDLKRAARSVERAKSNLEDAEASAVEAFLVALKRWNPEVGDFTKYVRSSVRWHLKRWQKDEARRAKPTLAIAEDPTDEPTEDDGSLPLALRFLLGPDETAALVAVADSGALSNAADLTGSSKTTVWRILAVAKTRAQAIATAFGAARTQQRAMDDWLDGGAIGLAPERRRRPATWTEHDARSLVGLAALGLVPSFEWTNDPTAPELQWPDLGQV